MTILTLINLIANILITLGVTFFTIGVFGRKSEKIESMNIVERLFIRLSLTITAAGSLFNCLTLSTPNNTEIMLNAGLGLLFLWAAWFHWKFFVTKK